MVGDFKQLTVWKRSRSLTIGCYHATAAFPPAEVDGLVSQIRRAAVSVAANIAEGCGRHSGKDQARSYRVSLGSARELEGLILLSVDLEFISRARSESFVAETVEVQKMLSALIRYCIRPTVVADRPSNSRLRS